MKHQIILIGKDVWTPYYGIKEFEPDHIHLLFTKETFKVANPIFSLLPESIKCTSYCVEAYDAKSVIEVCHTIHKQFAGDFTYNLSVGTKIMAFAAFSAAQSYGAISFYLSEEGEIIYLNTFEKLPMTSHLNNMEMLTLSGNVITSYFDSNRLQTEDVQASWLIKGFIEKYPKEHERIQSFYNTNCNRRLEQLPKTHTFSNTLFFQQDGQSVLIRLNEFVLLQIFTPFANMLYFEGRWWETLVADKVRLWSSEQQPLPEVWQSVVFHSRNSPELVKSEIDILVNNRQKLIIIECKLGKVNQNDVYKVDAVREIYGGDISQAILASYYPVPNNLREKCKSLQIAMFAPKYFADRIYHIETLPEWIDKLSRRLQI